MISYKMSFKIPLSASFEKKSHFSWVTPKCSYVLNMKLWSNKSNVHSGIGINTEKVRTWHVNVTRSLN